MVDKIHVLPGGRIDNEPVPQQEIIDALESLLEQAKSGELQGLAYAIVLANENLASGWKGAHCRSSLYASISWLFTRYSSHFGSGY